MHLQGLLSVLWLNSYKDQQSNLVKNKWLHILEVITGTLRIDEEK